ncbi:MAG: NAD-binding protein [Gordonia sp. (in: high G+C Gram-positive bacteria)]
MSGHIIVHGDDALSVRIVEEIRSTGVAITALSAPGGLVDAGIASASAVVCAGSDDAVNLEIALLARQHNPTVRVVAHLTNAVLREAVALGNGPGAILDVAELTAPLLVEALLGRSTHSITVADTEFVVSAATAEADGTLAELYGDLAPVAVIRGGQGSGDNVIACPSRALQVSRGDFVAMIATPDRLRAHGIVARNPPKHTWRQRNPVIRMVRSVRGFREDVNPNLFRALGALLTLLLGATVLLRLSYHRPGMSFVDALYFSSETIATVGYGDFSFVGQPTWLRVFSIILMFAGVTSTAILVAFIADVLLSRRIGSSAGRRRAREFAGHIIVVGLGSFGIRVAAELRDVGHDVVVIERDENNRFLGEAAELGVAVVFGDATLTQTLDDAHIEKASAVAVLTHDDMVNIETGIILRETLGARWSRSPDHGGVPVVLRVFDQALGSAVARRFGFANVRSTVELAAPWFIGAALGLQVLGTFSVGRRSFMVGGVFVHAGSELDGIALSNLSTQIRVIAISRGHGLPTNLRPRREDRLVADDIAYLVGPYHELLATLRRGRF